MANRRWTPEEIEALRASTPDMSISYLMGLTGRSRDAVSGMLARLGLTGGRSWHRWSGKEDALLRMLNGCTYKAAVAALGVFGRTPRAVENRARCLGVALKHMRRVRGVTGRQMPSSAGHAKRIVVRPARRGGRSAVRRLAVEYCPQCRAPVSDWQGHYERMGHRRPVAA